MQGHKRIAMEQFDAQISRRSKCRTEEGSTSRTSAEQTAKLQRPRQIFKATEGGLPDPFFVMSEDKKTLVNCQSFSTAIPEMSPATNWKSQSVKKYLIITASGLVAAALLLTAILVGMHLVTESHKNILMFTEQLDKNTRIDVIGDRDTNVVQYHTKNENYDTWSIDDFNRDIQVVKMGVSGLVNCFVTPLNRKTEGEPSKVFNPSNPSQLASNGTNKAVHVSDKSVFYSSFKSPILDTSFLSKAALDACKGVPIYWAIPSCGDSLEGSRSSSRQKRGVCCGLACACCPLVCYYACVAC